MLVCIESPYAGNVERNLIYLKHCMLESIFVYNEKPYASHAYLPLYLDDNDSKQREKGLSIGRRWGLDAGLRIFYVDLGISRGMMQTVYFYEYRDKTCITRKLTKEYFEKFENGCMEKGIEI